ncbi:MAG: iron-containing redox enzyme family protein [Sporichthyaceae bacterium]
MPATSDGLLREPVLPMARGPLSETMLNALSGRPVRPTSSALADADPYGDDLQLALYCAYEMHYRGFAEVCAEQEWDLVVLAYRKLLEKRFLAALRRDVPVDTAPLAQVITELTDAGAGTGISAALARRAELWQLRELAVHRCVYHLKEADPQAWVLPRLTGQAKAGVAAVEFDEYGGGRAVAMHAELFAALMRDLDLDPTYGLYLDLVPGIALAAVNFMSMCGLHRSLRGALVGQLATVEITSSPAAARMAAAVRKAGGGADAEHFYAEHAVADSVHEHVMREVIESLVAAEPALAADVIFGIRASSWIDAQHDQLILARWSRGESSLRSPLL